MFKRLWQRLRKHHDEDVRAETEKLARLAQAECDLAELQSRADAAVVILTSKKNQDAFADAFRTSIKPPKGSTP